VLCAGGVRNTTKLRSELRELWAALLISQNHDLFLAGDYPAKADGYRSFQSELAVRQFSKTRCSLSASLGWVMARRRRAPHSRF
jgi:hypothetical protein